MLLIVEESAKRSFTSCKNFQFDAKLSFALLLRFALFASLRSAIFNLLKRKSIITLEMAEQSEANRAKRSFASNFLKFYTLRRSFASRFCFATFRYFWENLPFLKSKHHILICYRFWRIYFYQLASCILSRRNIAGEKSGCRKESARRLKFKFQIQNLRFWKKCEN